MLPSTVVRCLELPEHRCLLAVGDFDPIREAYRTHVRRWDLPLDPLGDVMMGQALAGAALQLALLAPREGMAFTLQIPEPPVRLFVAGDAGDGTVVGRYAPDGEAEGERGQLHVQRIRAGGSARSSSLEVEGLDLLAIYEQFHACSEQTAARFLELDASRIALLRGHPGADAAWIRAVDAPALERLLAEEAEAFSERPFRLECGCNAERVVQALRAATADPEELFAGDEGLEAVCPRCGTRWWIDRSTYARHGGTA